MSSPSRFSLTLLAAGALLALPAFGSSQARIVRLSDVKGLVQIDKNTGVGFENAFVNFPITQGTRLRTRDTGRAEIEFEDGSSMRIGPNTSIDFSTLNLSDSGSRISEVNLTEGIAYVNWLAKGGDEFTLNFSREKLALDRPAHFRIDDSANLASLAVFKGDIDVDSPSGLVKVEKNKTATFAVNDDDKYKLQSKIEDDPLDSWDREASAYHDQYAKNQASSPYGYGLSDLNYYGSFNNIPGYGMMWQPFFTGVGWDPFMDGAWGWYPGMGYLFASAYPWGWLPYRYGNWMFVPSNGWMWQPGAWNTWNTVPHYTATSAVQMHPLVAPTGTVKTVAVGRGGVIPTLTSAKMTVNAGSAGLGIARGSLDNLKSLNHQVARSGFAQVRPQPAFATTAPARWAAFTGGSRGSTEGAGRGSAERSSALDHDSSIGRTSSMGTGHAATGGGHH